MPLERSMMPLERVNGPGGHRYRPGSETAGKHLSHALHRQIIPRIARPIVENSPACPENTSAAVVSPASRTPGSKVEALCTEGGQHSSKGRLYEYSAENRLTRWGTTNALLLENDPKTGGLQGEQFGSGGGGSDGERTT